MRLLLAIAALVLAPSAAIAKDNNDLDGFASISAGYNGTKVGDWSNENYYGSGAGTDGTRISGPDLEVRGSVAVPVGGAFGVQADGVFARTYYKEHDCSFCDTVHSDDSTVAIHAFARNPHKGAIGVFAQRTTQHFNWGSGSTSLAVGGETKLFMGRVSFAGQMAYVNVDTGNNQTKTEGPFASMNFRFFPQDNLMLELRGSHLQTKQSPNANSGYDCPSYCFTDKNIGWSLGGKAEYRLPASRVSFFAEVDAKRLTDRSTYFSDPYFSISTQKYSNVRAMFGVKFNFGSGSLFSRDRSGAAFEPIRFEDNLGFGSRSEA